MRRFPSMKIGLASFLSCLAIMLGMFTTTGTASAHSSNSARHERPIINVFDVQRGFGNCVSFELSGLGFSPGHHASLFAESRDVGDASIDPSSVRIRHNGTFDRQVQVCFSDQFSSCGEFIDNPFSFCGFGLNPDEFCQFGNESTFCFNGIFSQNQFSPVSVSEFCRFHEETFCFIHRHHRVELFVNAHDDHTGRDANGAFISFTTFG